MNLNEGAQKAYNNSKSKGFRDMEESIIKKMVANREFTDEECMEVESAFRGRRLMLIVSELGEAMEADRKGKHTSGPWKASVLNTLVDNDDRFNLEFKDKIKDTYEDEVADAAIRIMDLAGGEDIDLENHVQAKMRYNAGREKLHGKKY